MVATKENQHLRRATIHRAWEAGGSSWEPPRPGYTSTIDPPPPRLDESSLYEGYADLVNAPCSDGVEKYKWATTDFMAVR